MNRVHAILVGMLLQAVRSGDINQIRLRKRQMSAWAFGATLRTLHQIARDNVRLTKLYGG